MQRQVALRLVKRLPGTYAPPLFDCARAPEGDGRGEVLGEASKTRATLENQSWRPPDGGFFFSVRRASFLIRPASASWHRRQWRQPTEPRHPGTWRRQPGTTWRWCSVPVSRGQGPMTGQARRAEGRDGERCKRGPDGCIGSGPQTVAGGAVQYTGPHGMDEATNRGRAHVEDCQRGSL